MLNRRLSGVSEQNAGTKSRAVGRQFAGLQNGRRQNGVTEHSNADLGKFTRNRIPECVYKRRREKTNQQDPPAFLRLQYSEADKVAEVAAISHVAEAGAQAAWNQQLQPRRGSGQCAAKIDQSCHFTNGLRLGCMQHIASQVDPEIDKMPGHILAQGLDEHESPG